MIITEEEKKELIRKVLNQIKFEDSLKKWFEELESPFIPIFFRDDVERRDDNFCCNEAIPFHHKGKLAGHWCKKHGGLYCPYIPLITSDDENK